MAQKHLCILTATILCLVLIPGCGSSGPDPLPKAHAHNDYEHARPLFDALDRGFCSVEADIYLVDGKLLVAHNLKDTDPAKTLEALYLDPLKKRIKDNGGSVYRKGPEFTLLIDIKSNGLQTYATLHKLLSKYADILVTVKDGTESAGPVRIIISGNRVPGMMEKQPIRYAGLDGRFSDLDSDMPAHLMPWISDHAGKVSPWKEGDLISTREKQDLKDKVEKAHAKGRKLRLWATPDKPEVWDILQDCSVDIIGADNLDILAQYLK